MNKSVVVVNISKAVVQLQTQGCRPGAESNHTHSGIQHNSIEHTVQYKRAPFNKMAIQYLLLIHLMLNNSEGKCTVQ